MSMPDYSHTKQEWNPIASAPNGVTVMTKIDDGGGVRNIQPLKRQGSLWFIPNVMYVYYQPTHWRQMTKEDYA